PNMEQRLTKPLTSVDSLRPDDLYLNLLTRFAIRVPFHSIVGDVFGSQENPKGDGVVPYSSAHLDGAQSEKVVKWNHSLPTCPDAQQEVRRILLLHLK
ncbi:MAG: esterase/lipase family protein, partial [Planctomycetota bacterium]